MSSPTVQIFSPLARSPSAKVERHCQHRGDRPREASEIAVLSHWHQGADPFAPTGTMAAAG